MPAVQSALQFARPN